MDIERLASMLVVIFFAIGLHEYAHAKFADMAGDPTPRFYGRVTLNLFKHFDPLGTVMILITAIAGVGIGWGRPVPMDPSKMRNPKWDHFAAVFAGPFTNLVQAAVFGVLLRLLGPYVQSYEFLDDILVYGVLINLSLCFFNLIPLGPLDGMWLLGTFLGDKARVAWYRWNLTVGQFVFLAVVLVGQLNPDLNVIRHFVLPPLTVLFRLFTGSNFAA